MVRGLLLTMFHANLAKLLMSYLANLRSSSTKKTELALLAIYTTMFCAEVGVGVLRGTGQNGAKLRSGRLGMVLCPEGAMGLSPGFQPWEPSNQNGSP